MWATANSLTGKGNINKRGWLLKKKRHPLFHAGDLNLRLLFLPYDEVKTIIR